jgi:hypothetical protein
MKRYYSILPLALIVLALTGCRESRSGPQLTSPDRTERVEAVRDAQNRYGASPAPDRPVAAAGKEAVRGDDSPILPIDGPWMFKATLGGQSEETAVTIKGGELRVPGVKTYWKNIRPAPNSPARYSAVRVAPGLLYGTREDPVEFYLDADGILHYDDAQLAPLLRSLGIITLRRP